MFYLEGLWWYVLALDCLLYNLLAWTTPLHKWHSHWLSPAWPLQKLLGLFYFLLAAWLGFALWRLQLIF